MQPGLCNYYNYPWDCLMLDFNLVKPCLIVGDVWVRASTLVSCRYMWKLLEHLQPSLFYRDFGSLANVERGAASNPSTVRPALSLSFPTPHPFLPPSTMGGPVPNVRGCGTLALAPTTLGPLLLYSTMTGCIDQQDRPSSCLMGLLDGWYNSNIIFFSSVAS